MTTTIEPVERPRSLPEVSPEQLDLVRRTVAQGATDDELRLFLYDCQRRGVHPLDRLLHFTKRGGRYTPITSIDFFRARAAETGEHAGTDDAVVELDENDKPQSASVTVYRLVGVNRYAFSATARWAEYYPGEAAGAMWRKMPYTMISKCAEALALRKAFPAQLAGLYTADEMDQASPEPRQRVGTPRSGPAWKGNAKPGPLSDGGEYGDTPEPSLERSRQSSEPQDAPGRPIASGQAPGPAAAPKAVPGPSQAAPAQTQGQSKAAEVRGKLPPQRAAMAFLRRCVDLGIYGPEVLDDSDEGHQARRQIRDELIGPDLAMTSQLWHDFALKLERIVCDHEPDGGKT